MGDEDAFTLMTFLSGGLEEKLELEAATVEFVAVPAKAVGRDVPVDDVLGLMTFLTLVGIALVPGTLPKLVALLASGGVGAELLTAQAAALIPAPCAGLLQVVDGAEWRRLRLGVGEGVIFSLSNC